MIFDRVRLQIYIKVPCCYNIILEEPRGLGPAEDYTNLHKNIESKISSLEDHARLGNSDIGH